jgi:AbrB family looped-hinge helix DNA binding protein
MGEVKQTRRGRTRISSKNQATIPVEALRRAGLKPGDELVVQAAGAGRITLIRADDPIERHAGRGAGDYVAGYLDEMRDEWRARDATP